MNGEDHIKHICTLAPALAELFNARVRHYTIKQHTLNVFNQFEEYFSELFTKNSIKEFRLFLFLHDIGKSIAYKQGNREHQYLATINTIKVHQAELDISDKDFKLYKALISANIFGKYMENKASLDNTFTIIESQSLNLKLTKIEFFYYLSVYYQCDVASYTKDAGGIAYLEHIFKYENGTKVYCEKTNLLKFSNPFAQRYSLLLDKIVESSTQSNQPSDKNLSTIVPKEIKVKVVGKIDLSKFEKPKKQLSKTKENIYIIDTNVFVDQPEIIDNIEKKYRVILSAKVLDELDKLKHTLRKPEEKISVQRAIKSLSKSFDTRNIKMENSDLSLIPSDFDKRSPDNAILSVLLKFKDENPILLTSDIGLQVKAKALQLSTIGLKEFLKQKKRF
jgi:rRNA-processing protein FCF1